MTSHDGSIGVLRLALPAVDESISSTFRDTASSLHRAPEGGPVAAAPVGGVVHEHIVEVGRGAHPGCPRGRGYRAGSNTWSRTSCLTAVAGTGPAGSSAGSLEATRGPSSGSSVRRPCDPLTRPASR